MRPVFVIIFLLAAAVLSLTTAFSQEATPTPAPLEILVTEVVAVYDHDTSAFTQGLLWHDGFLYESTGQRGESTLRKVELGTGAVLERVDVPEAYFAEGLALADDRLIQLTWTSGEAFVYDLETFEQIDTFTYEGEGWGLCNDGELLVRSDGSDTLIVHDPQTFEQIDALPVTLDGQLISEFALQGRRVDQLNELECVGDAIYANVWFTDLIWRIDRQSGAITGAIFAQELLTPEERQSVLEQDSNNVLNGIAYNPETETFYLTGKRWPKIFEVRFVASPDQG